MCAIMWLGMPMDLLSDRNTYKHLDNALIFEEEEERSEKWKIFLEHHAKTSKAKGWAKSRPVLSCIESMMNSRVKKGNHMKNKNVNESEDNEDSQESFFPWKEELESLVHGGVPKDLQGRYGKLLWVSRHDEWKDIMRSCWLKKMMISIATHLDIMRTFPGHPTLNRDSLRRLLLAYARHNPSVGYCQVTDYLKLLFSEMSSTANEFLTGLLLLVMPEESAFWALVTIIDDYFEGYHTEGMIEYQVDQLVFDELMHGRYPKLVNHLDYLGVQVAWICAPWFLSIFINTLPWESGAALITTKDAGDAINLLQSLVVSTFDSSQLVLTACMGFLAVTDAKLRKLRDKLRPSVLLDVEERTKRSRFTKASKGLAYTRYCVKNERGSLLEEAKLVEDLADGDELKLESHSSFLDQLLCSLSADLVGSHSSMILVLYCKGPHTTDSFFKFPSLTVYVQADWMKVKLCRLLEDKTKVPEQSAVEAKEETLPSWWAEQKEELEGRIQALEDGMTENRVYLQRILQLVNQAAEEKDSPQSVKSQPTVAEKQNKNGVYGCILSNLFKKVGLRVGLDASFPLKNQINLFSLTKSGWKINEETGLWVRTGEQPPEADDSDDEPE
ncbi:Run and tbc1 domain containing 3 [Hibiscus syriacus]|uniref:Run and tbc1 domain containing 3 n=1 Tax=Hibiscus syriacus TaxID=106335 RepID=A0A6A2W9B9_HIBSY|nr:Run and tbc1 domain containing 3 [Hibiscus syriacus]